MILLSKSTTLALSALTLTIASILSDGGAGFFKIINLEKIFLKFAGI